MKVLIVSADRTLASGHPQNIGDAFLTDALSKALREAGLDVVIADFGAADRIESTEHRERIGGVRGLASLIRSADAVVLGGGTLLADDQPTRAFAGLPRLCAVTAMLARVTGKKFLTLGVGMDPVERRWARLALTATLRLGRIWIRDPASAARAAALMRRTPQLSGDVSLFHADERRTRNLPDASRSGAVLALNRREAAKLTVAQVEAVRSAHGSVTFVSMDQGDDADVSSLAPAVATALGVPSGVQTRSWASIIDTIGSADVVIGSRMHALYMAVMAGVPAIALSGTPKLDAFIDEFGVASARTLEEAERTTGSRDPDRVALAARRLRDAGTEAVTWMTT